MELVCCLLTKVFVALNKGKRNLDSSNLYNPVNHSLLRYLALNSVIYVEFKLSSSSLERLSKYAPYRHDGGIKELLDL